MFEDSTQVAGGSLQEFAGAFTAINGEVYARIAGHERLSPFLMALASPDDLWMFVTSRGGLTAGRTSPDGSVFPYVTVDKLLDAHHHTGPITLLRGARGRGQDFLWEPFGQLTAPGFRIERNLYKNTLGSRLIFEELNHDLDLAFRYRWAASGRFGWVRTAALVNRGTDGVDVQLLDGLRNVLPHGAPLALYQQASSLIDAYKRCDYDPRARLAVFSLTAQILDRPEVGEVLRANTVWCHGLESYQVSLADNAVGDFRRGERPAPVHTLTGRRGNYLVTADLHLEPTSEVEWHLVADAGSSHVQLAKLSDFLLTHSKVGDQLKASLAAANQALIQNVGSADGLQVTGRPRATIHHFANVLFNNMRGGVFADNGSIERSDLEEFVAARNSPVAKRAAGFFAELPPRSTPSQLRQRAVSFGDPDLERLCLEYLPLYFGRRHGDPSRPWNRFAIATRSSSGDRALGYEGNWRDIFQNWEALCHSFPAFLPAAIATFVNASTVDGFNPYRITRDGVDWEEVAPDHPWSNIGYWGDHQIIYLLRLLEALQRFAPGALCALSEREIFAYCNVPYRLKPYAELLRDPHGTVDFDDRRARAIDERVGMVGGDGKLLADVGGSVYRVNLVEKLMVPALAKLSNLILDGGIWMNTQRPEWNDAQNALAGNGVSAVTLCYLHRYLVFLKERLEGLETARLAVSSEVATWLAAVHQATRRLAAVAAANQDTSPTAGDRDRHRRQFLDAVGSAFADYRERVYDSGFSGKVPVAVSELVEFCGDTAALVRQSVGANRRADGLYHAYHIWSVRDDALELEQLAVMLEGQVAALSSGVVEPREAVEVLDALYDSPLFRKDLQSFLLYPERQLPAFVDKNVLPVGAARKVPLLCELLAAGDASLIVEDALGVYRFNADLENVAAVEATLAGLAASDRWAADVARDRAQVLELYEQVFGHRAFTGRSGTMYGYEGIGCVYWHMVAKLLLAVQELALTADERGDPVTASALAAQYVRIRSGLGFEKTAEEFGAFPTDPYSHTPRHAGAQQPGMTGQVKEEILARLGELGVRVKEGAVRFRPFFLSRAEFLDAPASFGYYDLAGNRQRLPVDSGTLVFSFCQVPVVYRLIPEAAWLRITRTGRAPIERQGTDLTAAESRELFERTGRLSLIEVGVPESWLAT